MLTKDDILNADDIKTKDVDVPEWGGTVRIRTMTGADRMRFQRLSAKQKGKSPDNLFEALLIATVIDDNGDPLFTPADIVKLSEKSNVAIQRVFEAAAKLNGLGDGAIDDLAGE